jgi:uncharacterized membrane protein YbaN (DUF454 family)
MDKRNPLRKMVGYALIFLGIIGLFLPVLQGIVFITAGLYLIESDALKRLSHKLTKCLQRKKR